MPLLINPGQEVAQLDQHVPSMGVPRRSRKNRRKNLRRRLRGRMQRVFARGQFNHAGSMGYMLYTGNRDDM